MGTRDRMFELTEVEQVNEFLRQYPTGVFFKAGGCHKTMQGFGYVEEALNPYEDLYVGFVRVIESRPVSNYIAELTGVVHQSPQFILMKDGEPVFDVDNWNINLELLQEVLEEHFGSAENEESNHKADISVYLDILNRYLSEEMSETDFHDTWLMTFQSDATPRSTKQFNQLNRLFGDVDAAIVAGPLAVAKGTSLRERAQVLYGELQESLNS